MPAEFALCIPDEHYEHIIKLIDEGTDNKIPLKDKSGITQIFYKENEVLYADKEELDGNTLKQRVITFSQAQDMAYDDKFRNAVEKKVKDDFPSATEEEVNEHVEFLTEVNKSIKRLVQSGMPKSVAVKLISSIIDNSESITNLTDLEDFVRLVSSTPPEINKTEKDENEISKALKELNVKVLSSSNE